MRAQHPAHLEDALDATGIVTNCSHGCSSTSGRTTPRSAQRKHELARARYEDEPLDPVVHFAALRIPDARHKDQAIQGGARLLAAHPTNRWMLLAQGVPVAPTRPRGRGVRRLPAHPRPAQPGARLPAVAVPVLELDGPCPDVRGRPTRAGAAPTSARSSGAVRRVKMLDDARRMFGRAGPPGIRSARGEAAAHSVAPPALVHARPRLLRTARSARRRSARRSNMTLSPNGRLIPDAEPASWRAACHVSLALAVTSSGRRERSMCLAGRS